MGVFPANRECSRLVHGVMRNDEEHGVVLLDSKTLTSRIIELTAHSVKIVAFAKTSWGCREVMQRARMAFHMEKHEGGSYRSLIRKDLLHRDNEGKRQGSQQSFRRCAAY